MCRDVPEAFLSHMFRHEVPYSCIILANSMEQAARHNNMKRQMPELVMCRVCHLPRCP